MKLKEFVNSRVEMVEPSATLQRAAKKMSELNVGSLPVCDNGQLVGMITDRDITIRAVARGSDPAVATVSEVMTPDVLWCFEDEDVEEAARTMRDHQVRRIMVLNEAKELVGITSLGELATATGDRLLAGETLQAVSEESRKFRQSDVDVEEADGNEEPNAGSGEGGANETRVTGILDGIESAKAAIEELKSAGFANRSILVAMSDPSIQESFPEETLARTMSEEEIASLPELKSGQILIMVEAEERVDDALKILNRHHAITAGVRIPIV